MHYAQILHCLASRTSIASTSYSIRAMRSLSMWYTLARECSVILRTWVMQVNNLNTFFSSVVCFMLLCFSPTRCELSLYFTADFFPNNGKARQPGCVFPFDLIGGCSHGRSYQYFAESIESKRGFMALACRSWEDYISKNCIGDLVPMGFILPNSTRGTFFLQTGEGPKFARLEKIN